MKKVIEVQNLSFGYNEQIILKNINLDVYKGDYLGLIGPNGSAKSTLIKLMLGILKPLGGKVKLFDRDINKFTHWSKIGYVSQKATSFNTSFPATVEEILRANLIAASKDNKKLSKKDNKSIDRVLDTVKMQDFKNKLIGNLSGGQQQRIFIAKALISNPELLFLDEPTVGIDAASQELFYDIIGKLNKEFKMTIILVSHDIGVITEKVTRIACMGNNNLYTHDSTSPIEMDKFIKTVYGEKVKVLDHHKH